MPVVVCPVERSARSEARLRVAHEICARHSARLIIEHNLSLVPSSGRKSSRFWPEETLLEEGREVTQARRLLDRWVSEYSRTVPCEARMTRGRVDEALLHVVRDSSASLVIIGRHRWCAPEHRDITRRFIQRCPAPVLVAGERMPSVESLRTLLERAHEPTPVDLNTAVHSESGVFELGSVAAGERYREQLLVAASEVADALEANRRNGVGFVVRRVQRSVRPWRNAEPPADLDFLPGSKHSVLYLPPGFPHPAESSAAS